MVDVVSSEKRKQAAVVVAVVAAALFASLPAFLTYLPYSSNHDITFHLMRIEGIAEGLRNGDFPVRMQTVQINGFGYPVSVTYGDLFLYIPAILRLVGLSLQGSYSVFVFLANLFCASITYVVTKRIFGLRSVALMACALWTFAPYRLLDNVWLRAAVGEYLALGFLPVIAYGLFSIFMNGRHEGASRNGWAWCGFGVCGIVYSHVLSILLAIIIFAPVLIAILIARHDKETLLQVVKAIAAAVFLSLAFVVPFLDYYANANMLITDMTADDKRLQAATNAMQLPQLLFFFPPVEGWSIVDPFSVNEMPMTIGAALFFGGVIWLLAVIMQGGFREGEKTAFVVGIIGCVLALLLAFMASYYFPWDSDVGSLLNKVIGTLATIQFPWRLLGPISFVMVVLGCLAVVTIKDKVLSRAVAAMLACLVVLEAGCGLTSFMNTAAPLDEGLNVNGVMNGEYLPSGTIVDKLYEEGATEPKPSEGAVVNSFEKKGTDVSISVSAEKDSTVLLPLLSYPGYELSTSIDGASLGVGENNVMELSLPAGADGEVSIAFREPMEWRVSEIVSLLALIVVVVCCAAARWMAKGSNDPTPKGRHGRSESAEKRAPFGSEEKGRARSRRLEGGFRSHESAKMAKPVVPADSNCGGKTKWSDQGRALRPQRAHRL